MLKFSVPFFIENNFLGKHPVLQMTTTKSYEALIGDTEQKNFLA